MILHLRFLNKFSDFGFFIIRVVVGACYVLHGYPKMIGGPDKWVMLAGYAGITQVPMFFGFLAAFAEFCGGICLVLGFMTRPMALLMFGTMLGALHFHIGKGDHFNDYSHALEMAAVFLGLAFIGPGKYSIDRN